MDEYADGSDPQPHTVDQYISDERSRERHAETMEKAGRGGVVEAGGSYGAGS